MEQKYIGVRNAMMLTPNGKYRSRSMTVNRCKLCGAKTISFIWSTSRNIDQERLKKITQETPRHLAYPICWACIRKHNLIISTKEDKNDAKKI